LVRGTLGEVRVVLLVVAVTRRAVGKCTNQAFGSVRARSPSPRRSRRSPSPSTQRSRNRDMTEGFQGEGINTHATEPEDQHMVVEVCFFR
jgi:hypothetical protein